MKYEELRSFLSDWSRLSGAEQSQFIDVIRSRFHPACERLRTDPSAGWPRGLGVKRVQGAPGIWEMTWSFAAPDGRATFEWVSIDGEPAIRWRRIGGHAILARP